MLRSIRLFIGAAAVLFGGFVLAQPPKDAPNADGYFPIKAKSKWTYKIQDQTIEVQVSGTEKVGTEDCTKVDTIVGGKVVASELYAIRVDGVYRVKVKDDKIDPPVKVLQLPVNKGASWEVKSKVGMQTVSGTFKIKDDKEKIETPAGKFEAVLVEGIDLDVAGTKTTVRTWYVKDKGIVKIEYKIGDAASTLELTKAEIPAATN